jgi:hypothetical protein
VATVGHRRADADTGAERLRPKPARLAVILLAESPHGYLFMADTRPGVTRRSAKMRPGHSPSVRSPWLVRAALRRKTTSTTAPSPIASARWTATLTGTR